MIDYLNSRVLLTIAAVAMTSLVIFAAISTNSELSRNSTYEIAERISTLINEALEIDCEFLESRLSLDRNVFGADIEVHLNDSWVIVQNKGYKSIQVFNAIVELDGIEKNESCLIAYSESVIVISSTSVLMDKMNHVTVRIEML